MGEGERARASVRERESERERENNYCFEDNNSSLLAQQKEPIVSLRANPSQ